MKKRNEISLSDLKSQHHIVPVLVTLFFVLLNLYLLVRHEPWRDEAQAWLIARDLSFIDIFKQLRYEGHPFLWYILLAPFAKLGLPYIVNNLISLAVMSAAVYLTLKYLPIPMAAKAVVVFGAGFVYYNPVISRSYSLVALLIVLSAILYKTRREHPYRYLICLSLLMQTHVLILGFVGALVGLFLLEEVIIQFKANSAKRKLGILAIPFASLGLLLVQLFSSIASNTNVEVTTATKNDTFLKASLTFLQTVFRQYSGIELTAAMFLLFMLILTLTCLATAFYYPKQVFVLFAGVLWFLILHHYVYNAWMLQKQLVLYFIFLFSIWTAFYEKPLLLIKPKVRLHKNKVITACGILLAVVSAVSFSNLSKYVKAEIEHPYSLAKNVAEYISTELPRNAVLIAADDTRTSAIKPYLHDQRVWNPITQEDFSFITWNEERTKTITTDELQARIEAAFDASTPIYIIVSHSSLILEDQVYYDGLEMVQEFIDDAALTDEDTYFIYRIQ